LIEAYVFRRAICAIPTNSMNKTFATFSKALKKDRYLESIQAHFLTLPSYLRIPTKPATHSEAKAATLPEGGGEQGSWWIEVAALRPVNGR
jgi:uncharacterized protein with ParB-like and HNH nuclease domain